MVSTTDKKLLRAKAKARRLEMSPAEVEQKSKEIWSHFKARFPLSEIRCLHIFHSIARFNEVDTSEFVKGLYARYPNLHIASPVVDKLNDRLNHVRVGENIRMEVNAWGIPEPTSDTVAVNPKEVDLVVVPMLAFDCDGNRIGYGKGYYDNFLALTRADCLRVGVCFANGLIEDGIRAEAHDVPLDYVVTEEKVWHFPDNPQPNGTV